MSQHKDVKQNISAEKNYAGVSLIELMIAVAIIGLLATLAFPTFQGHILQSRRNDCANQLLGLKLQQETFRLNHPNYATTSELNIPASEFFTFSVVNPSATSFTLVALAKGSQTADSACQSIAIDQSMNRTPSFCW